MSIFKVIGWTDYSNKKYADCDFCYSIYYAVADELYDKKYIFDGGFHQNAKSGCPVLNNGKKFCTSLRDWGDLMAEVVNRDGTNYDYMDFYMDIPQEIYEGDKKDKSKKLAFPKPRVDKSQISSNLSRRKVDTLKVAGVTLCEIEKGGITAAVSTNYYFGNKKKEDLIEFYSYEDEQLRYILTEIVSVSKFETFKDFMESDIAKKTEYASIPLAEAQADFVKRYEYNPEPLKDVMAFEFKKFTE